MNGANNPLAAVIQAKHHRLLLSLRSKDRIIQSELFTEVWNKATKNQKAKIIIGYFNQPLTDDFDMKKWILEVMGNNLEQYPIKILRKLASYHRIKDYSRLSKAQLLITLAEKGIIYGDSHIS